MRIDMDEKEEKERNTEIMNFDNFRWLEGQIGVFITYPKYI